MKNKAQRLDKWDTRGIGKKKKESRGRDERMEETKGIFIK